MIEPQGESSVDEVRFKNLEDTIELVDKLIDDIVLVARHKNRPEYSMSKAGKEAEKFINRIREQLEEIYLSDDNLNN